MSTALTPSTLAPKPRGYFGRALLIGALLELGLLAGLIWWGSQKSPPPPPKPKRIAIHMVQPPKPKPLPPPPKPVVHPKPVPKPVPKPIPRPVPHPIPHPVVHHAPTPKPLMAKAPQPTAPVVPPAPPVTPPPPPPPAPSPALAQAAIARYAALVRSQVQSQAHVPEAVRLMHLSGTAVISFELLPSGSLVWAKLAQSSGVGAIDRAALAAVKAGSYPPFTKNMPKKPTQFDVEVHLSANS
ncbi:energy transducer TonB [Candidatus Igneacidithiobacillus taiwanensis]|uniref:energy transducer TonB n=1 Tax=Candidatus Igneacidithiobacillus taiwanensis TaxID=1945924 RepID=UPI0028988718|nr:energy transducer TonB [Candidatus Igneacidithiobacillus taiwanensis]